MLYWTNGHPFLTQRLCRAIADDARVEGKGDVHRLCNNLFLTRRAQELDDNLLFVRDSILRSEEDKATLIELVRESEKGKHLEDDVTNTLVIILRLSGSRESDD